MGFIKKYIDYIKDNPQGYWFRRKIFGWGWTPARWQGWLVLALFISYAYLNVFFMFPPGKVTSDDDVTLFLVRLAAGVAVLVAVCYYKGEPPKWQWGFPEDGKKDDKK